MLASTIASRDRGNWTAESPPQGIASYYSYRRTPNSPFCTRGNERRSSEILCCGRIREASSTTASSAIERCPAHWPLVSRAVRRSCEIEAGGTRIGDQCRVGRDGGGGAMARGIARAVSFGGRATAGWCSYRRVTVAVCIGNLVAALLVLRSLTAPASFAPTAPNSEWNLSPRVRICFLFDLSERYFDLSFRRWSGGVHGGAD
jgi:hypothetical protein